MKKIYLLFTALAAVGTLTGCGVFEEFGNEANGTPSPIRRLFFFKKQFNSFL